MRKNEHLQRGAAQDRRTRDLFSELSDLRMAVEDAYMRFNVTTEPELVDACVYEINAAQSRYNYMIRMIRERDGEAALPKTLPEGADTAWA